MLIRMIPSFGPLIHSSSTAYPLGGLGCHWVRVMLCAVPLSQLCSLTEITVIDGDKQYVTLTVIHLDSS